MLLLQKSFPRTEITMDHLYPRTTGGSTIPQNLLPACKHCNTEKAYMTKDQFLHYLSLSSETDVNFMFYSKILSIFSIILFKVSSLFVCVSIYSIPYWGHSIFSNLFDSAHCSACISKSLSEIL